MAQRISRAKRTVRDVRFDQPGDLATVLRVLYLVFNEGYTGDVDLAEEAIRLARQLSSMTNDERGGGPARADAAAPRPATSADGATAPRPTGRPGPDALGHRADRRGRRGPAGRTGPRPARRVPGPGRDRRPARRRAARRGDRLGADRRAGTTSCSGSPAPRSCGSTAPSRSVRPTARVAGLAALADGRPGLPRHAAASAYLHERAGDLPTAARLYAEAARPPPNPPSGTTSSGRRRGSARRCVAPDLPVAPDLVPDRGRA